MISRTALSLLALVGAFQTPIPAPSAPVAPPYAGTVREGRAELQRLAEAARHDEASQHAASVFAKPEFEREAESERAEFWFAAGVARGAAMAFEEAAEASHAARGLAGSSQLGLAAAYNAGTFRLMRAEELRLEIPEVREKLALPPKNAAPPGAPPNLTPGALQSANQGAPSGADAPDPLEVARNAYQLARADLVERWRADPQHVDTRANLELVQRRMRELDELQREREQQQEQDQQDQEQKQDPNQKQDPQQDPEQNKDPNQQDPQQDPSQEQPPKDDPQDDSKNDESQEPKPDEQPPQPDENEQQQDPESKDQADPAQPQDERTLTPEEVQRLLQQLEKIDDQAQQVQAALRRARRTPVKKDW